MKFYKYSNKVFAFDTKSMLTFIYEKNWKLSNVSIHALEIGDQILVEIDKDYAIKISNNSIFEVARKYKVLLGV